MYGSDATVLSMLVSSACPHQAGLTVPLVELLIDFGASPDALGTGQWNAPLHAALVFGYRDAAEALVRRGATVDTLPLAAGLGLTDRCTELLATSSPTERLAALAMAVMNREVATARLLLESRVDPSAYHPDGYHSHATPLHQAALAGDVAMIDLLLNFGADPARRDTLYHTIPLGWAEHGDHATAAERLRPISPAD
jgi:peptide-methionine (S)-S-oxide reductase